MLSWINEKLGQRARNRDKARALVNQYGDAAEDYVRARIASNAWEIRNQSHWMRVNKHIQKLLRQRD